MKKKEFVVVIGYLFPENVIIDKFGEVEIELVGGEDVEEVFQDPIFNLFRRGVISIKAVIINTDCLDPEVEERFEEMGLPLFYTSIEGPEF